MLQALVLLVASCIVATAADFTPTAPGPGDIFAAGSPCSIQWNADTSGKWTNVSIYLMSGSNDNMRLLSTVASGLDGTDDGLSPYKWTCPEVDPYSAIYFYQFTNGDDRANSKWTTRFTITSSSGDSEQPEHKTQPNGDAVPWGVGRLAMSDSKSTGDNSTSASMLGSAIKAIKAQSSSSDDSMASNTHKHAKSTLSAGQSGTAGHSHSKATGSPSSTTSNGLVNPSIPTASLPVEKVHSSRTRTHSSSSQSVSPEPSSQMGPGVPEVGGMQLASSGSVQRANLWSKARFVYPCMLAMLL